MKKLLNDHLEKILLSVAIGLSLFVVLIYFWGVRGLGSVMGKVASVIPPNERESSFNIEGAKKVLEQRGLRQ